MLKLNQVHHIAIICKDYNKSKQFYTGVLGLKIEQEIFREERNSYKLDLSLNGKYIIELFSFINPPQRPSQPEAAGLRHLAFEVDSMDDTTAALQKLNIYFEPVRTDLFTGKKFTFIADPDDLPVEFYER
jgi:glyoxylase I family protein